MHRALRLRCSAAALRHNYQTLSRLSGVRTAAAVKANAYGLGARAVVEELLDVGCRDFFISSWAEAQELASLPSAALAVLHGIGPEDEAIDGIRPVLNSPDQVQRWKASRSSASECDVMVDTGMNRLGIALEDLEVLRGLNIHTCHSHLACADENHPLNLRQLTRFKEARAAVQARRYSLANSAGIFLGQDYSFDLVRPGLALYGGVPRSEAREHLQQVAHPEAQVLQCRHVRAGDTVGYNATYVASADLRVAILNIGYADGYRRAFSSLGTVSHRGVHMPVLGRVSMDLIAVDATNAPDVEEGVWIELDYELERSSELTGVSQYELLTGLGQRFERVWS